MESTIPMSSITVKTDEKPQYPDDFFQLPAGVDPVFPPSAFIVNPPPLPVVVEEEKEAPKAIPVSKSPRRQQQPAQEKRMPIPQKKLPPIPLRTNEPVANKFESSINIKSTNPPMLSTSKQSSGSRLSKSGRILRQSKDRALKKGPILKKSKGLLRWQRRYIKLYSTYIEYYARSTDSVSGEPDVVIQLANFTFHEDSDLKDGNYILLRHREGKGDYMFQGVRQTDHEEWGRLFKEQIGLAPGPSLSSASAPQDIKHDAPLNLQPSKRFFKQKKKRPDSTPFTPSSGKVFGLRLQDIEDIDEELHIPKILVDTTKYLMHNVTVEGIFRKSGSVGLINSISQKYDAGEPVVLDDILDPHAVAGILKKFLRELKEPLLTYEFYDDWMKFESVPDENKLLYVRKFFGQLPPLNLNTWKYLLEFLVKVNLYESENLMGVNNLGIVFGPNILWKENGTMEDTKLESRVVTQLVAFFITNYEFITKPAL